MSNEFTSLANFGINSNGNVVNRGQAIAAAITALPNTATMIAAGTADAQGVAAATGLRLTGVSLAETAGAATVVTIRHGTANSDPAILHINLAANESREIVIPSGGISTPNGIWVDRESGTTEVTVYSKIITLAS